MHSSSRPRKAWHVGVLAIALSVVAGSCGGGGSSSGEEDTEGTAGETEADEDGEESTTEAPEGTADGTSTGVEEPTGCESIVDILLVDEEAESTDMPELFCAGTTGLAPAGTWGYDPVVDTYWVCTEALGPGSTEHLMPAVESGARRQRWLGLFTYRDDPLFPNPHDAEQPHYVAVLLDIYDDTWIGACGSSQWDELGDTAKAMQDGLTVGAQVCMHTPMQILSTADPGTLQIQLGAQTCPVNLHKVFEL